ncbi:alpha/beta hydrolase [Roseivivax sediminis]|uniref:Alpha/beta hydrolase family protein n=1 Tax=Roseivivax sediminis TaxID=936889 RepID=A0A1I1ZBU8_9RHOB|nr:alpha/beta hydrolase fold domain-containing protein [Roseivivax sediminis]SFE29304.1 Alpha/beta hydrolase family protein [Roseivivax sediminis]
MDLDDAYDNQSHVPDAADYPPRWAAEAEAYRKRLGAANRARLGLMYGHGTRQVMDLFTPVGRRDGLAIFVHGGYWRRFGRGDFSHFADGLVLQHWAVAMPSYDLCPRARISDIMRQVASAVAAVARELPDLPIRLVGHSAGGQLVARMLAPGVLPEEVGARIERVMPISPVSDLRPLLRTSINDDLQLEAEEAAAESPVLMDPPRTPVSVWVGGDELPAFLDQARWLAEAWGAEHVVEDGKHHFNVIDGLLDPESRMIRTLLA